MEIEAKFDDKTKLFEIKNYNAIKNTIEAAIVSCNPNLVITSEFDLAVAKANRTKLRKAKEIIANGRKALNQEYMGTFNAQCKELETELDTADDALKASVDLWKAEHTEEVQAPVGTINNTNEYLLIIKTKDNKLIDEINKLHRDFKFEMEVK